MLSDGLLNQTLIQMGTLFAAGAVTASIFHRFRLPSVLGYIIIGVVLGPSVLNWIDKSEIAFLSQLGIIFLLFLVGLELSISKIKRLKWQAPLAGFLQLTFCGMILTLLLYLLGLPGQLAFLLGSILSLSSTAIVLKRLEEQREMESLHGRIILAILIIQDMAIIPLMTLVASLSQPFDANQGFLSIALPTLGGIFKALLVAVITFTVSVKLFPAIMDRLVKHNQKEIFLLTSIAIVFGASWLANWLGISYEAGALIAGISMSGSLFSHQMFADTRSYRDVFVMLFFTSMGLWVDVHFIAVHWQMVLLVTVSIMLIKAIASYGAVRLSGLHHQNALWAGLTLFQVGEFSFVALNHLLKSVGTVPQWAPTLEIWSPLLSNAIVLTMLITPLVIQCVPHIIKKHVDAHNESTSGNETPKAIEADILVAGYGPVAQQLTHALRQMDLSYCIIEMNANTVKSLQAINEPCIYGDVAHADILQTAGIENARFFILTFPDVKAAEAAIRQAKLLNPEIITLVRARYVMDVPTLKALGADHIVCEEYETSLDFVRRLLRIEAMPEAEIQEILATLMPMEHVLS